MLNQTRADSLQLPSRAGDKQVYGNLSGGGLDYLVSEILNQRDGLTLVITSTPRAAERLEQTLEFYLSHRDDINVLAFPDWETLPFDTFSPHQDIVSRRLLTLYQLPQTQRGVLIVPVSTLMHRLPPKDYVRGNSLVINKGDPFDINVQRSELEQAGYRCVDTVYEHGEFSVRGSLTDIFPMGSKHPYRIDLFDDEIDSLRRFDPETQRSDDPCDSIELLPAREFPMAKEAIKAFRSRFRDRFDVDYRQVPLYRDIGEGLPTGGIEYYLPLFFEQTATLFDYLPRNTLILTEDQLNQAIDTFWQDINERYENRRVDPERPLLAPHEMFIPAESLFSQLGDYPRLSLTADEQQEKAGRFNLPQQELTDVQANPRAEAPLANLEAFLELYQQQADEPLRVLFTAESPGRRENLEELLQQNGISTEASDSWHDFQQQQILTGLTIAPLEQSLWLPKQGWIIIPEACLLGSRVMQQRRQRTQDTSTEQVIRNLTELRVGAPVVHLDHGVGRYRGLQTITVDNQPAEFLMLEYADEAKLYVPVSSLHQIARYTGADDELAPLHKLGSEQWTKAKRKAQEKARDTAAELLDIYARREARKGFGFEMPDMEYNTFANAFPFEETRDQETAISAVIGDMTTAKPMDRLVCGDVGFGKTEVAMRAAFLAVQSGKQVAVLVPTTLLAQQHYESFRDRFADWPVQVDVISRFRTAKQVSGLQEQVNEGKVDILIGTHKLLQGDLKFKNLGLLIIDEEHRFGVRQKEALKAMRAEVDILTLTATPIPRTLNMAMSGMRDLSIIATPPARRLSIKTFVRQSDKPTTKEAILRELLRGGQVYYLHNEVKTIEKVAADLQELVPEARIAVGHGQMRERELEQVMSDFYHKRFNVLVCTTIIETGIDVPSANTIIIDRADKFGLAQLHQLRGRVGRSHHQAYAYLLTPHPKSMTSDAVKRLDAISQSDTLGAGFTLATHDMEIRGAGELLGDDQSGQIQSVGFTLFMEMLERAVEAIKEGKEPNLDQPLNSGAEINLHIPALLPEDYVGDVHTRLIIYKRIAGCENDDALQDMQAELVDRFGPLPEPSKHLLRQASLRLLADKLGIVRIDAGTEGGKLEFSPETSIDPMKLVQLVQSQPRQFRLEGATVMKYSLPMPDADRRISALRDLLQQLAR
ncbi:transcription-repair coupling factor [Endozoicomonadaceae bacterium StTr2]